MELIAFEGFDRARDQAINIVWIVMLDHINGRHCTCSAPPQALPIHHAMADIGPAILILVLAYRRDVLDVNSRNPLAVAFNPRKWISPRRAPPRQGPLPISALGRPPKSVLAGRAVCQCANSKSWLCQPKVSPASTNGLPAASSLWPKANQPAASRSALVRQKIRAINRLDAQRIDNFKHPACVFFQRIKAEMAGRHGQVIGIQISPKCFQACASSSP